MKNTIKIAAGVVAFVLVMDAFAFFGWVISGQHPQGEAYAGTITAHIIGSIINK